MASPIGAVCLMASVIIGFEQLILTFDIKIYIPIYLFLIIKIGVGGGVYFLYFFLFDREVLKKVKKLKG